MFHHHFEEKFFLIDIIIIIIIIIIYLFIYLFIFIFTRKSLDPAFSFQKLILHCITAIHNSLKCLAIITAKNEADNRVDSRVCVRHVIGDNEV